jgi:hypothetical protein
VTPTDAVVAIFLMFFVVVFVGILSHHILEDKRLSTGYYDKFAPTPKDDGPEEERDENEVL